MVMEAISMDNYAKLSDENKKMADNFINYLVYNQNMETDREKRIMEAIKEYEDGKAVGPFNSVEELMADLNA